MPSLPSWRSLCGKQASLSARPGAERSSFSFTYRPLLYQDPQGASPESPKACECVAACDEEKYINRLDKPFRQPQRDAILLHTMKRQPKITSKARPSLAKTSHMMQADTQSGKHSVMYKKAWVEDLMREA